MTSSQFYFQTDWVKPTGGGKFQATERIGATRQLRREGCIDGTAIVRADVLVRSGNSDAKFVFNGDAVATVDATRWPGLTRFDFQTSWVKPDR